MDCIRKARPDRVVAATSLATLLSVGAAGAQTTTGRGFAVLGGAEPPENR